METCIFILCSALFGIDFELVTSKYPNILEVSDPSYIHYPYLEVVKVLNDTSILEIESQRQQLELVVMHAMTYFMWHWLLQSTPISIEIYHQLHPVLQQLFSWLLQLKSKKSMISPMLQKFYDFVYFPIKPLQVNCRYLFVFELLISFVLTFRRVQVSLRNTLRTYLTKLIEYFYPFNRFSLMFVGMFIWSIISCFDCQHFLSPPIL